ncbi:MAG: YicC family protein [Bacteroidetes bacterium]|nr:YicC family protein [Bacteroidota bacterium]
MLYSMTGFGRAESTRAGRNIIIELKSLNGKGFEANTNKLSVLVSAWEIPIRNLLSSTLLRGTLDVKINLKDDSGRRRASLNTDVATAHFLKIKELADALQLPTTDLLPALLQLPEVWSNEQEALPETEWEALQDLIAEAAQQLMEHRRAEGAALQQDLENRLASIEASVGLLQPLEDARMKRIRERLLQALEALKLDGYDPNRFEQEMIFYLEKMDVSEEKTRLTQHISYFREKMLNTEVAKGKILGFILQEIGREINTLGAKANDAEIQQIVVGMKDELEKAKEQVLNVL